jgi:hypothetical protein
LKKVPDRPALKWLEKRVREMRWASSHTEEFTELCRYLATNDVKFQRLIVEKAEAEAKVLKRALKMKERWDRHGWPDDFHEVVQANKDQLAQLEIQLQQGKNASPTVE